MNHDSKHHEIYTEVRTKEPRRTMEQVLELERSTRRIWTNTGTTSPFGVNSEQEEDSGQTTNEIGVQTLVLTLVSREQEIQSLKEASKILES